MRVPMFELQVQDGIVIVQLRGQMLGDDTSRSFIDKVFDHIKQGRTRVILDVSQLDWINSMGLSILINLWKVAHDAGGDVRLVNPSDKVEKLLVVSRLVSVFNVYESVEEAVESFKDE